MADSDGRHRRQVGKCEELRFRGDGACFAWRKATVDEIVEHFKNRGDYIPLYTKTDNYGIYMYKMWWNKCCL